MTVLIRSIRYAAAVFLTAFIIAAFFLPHRKAEFNDGISAVFCHSVQRCPACRKVERITQQVLNELQGDVPVQLIALEYDVPENRTFVETFDIGTATVILIERKNGQTIRSRDLTAKIWNTIDDDAALQKVLEDEIIRFITQPTAIY